MALFFQTRRLHSVFRQCSLNLRRSCVSASPEDIKQNSRKEKRRKRREEGIRTHAIYHIKVNEIASEFRLKRLEEEKQLNTEQQKKEDLRRLEKKTHDGVIESVILQNKLLQFQREVKKEVKNLLHEERERKREQANKKIWARQHQERVEHVKNAIEESKNWVTKENLEEKIAYCLEHETNYNFALTPTGEKVFSDSAPGCLDTERSAPGPAAYLTTSFRS